MLLHQNTFSLSAEITHLHHGNPYVPRGNTCHLDKVKGRWYKLDELIPTDWGPLPLPRAQGMSSSLRPREGVPGGHPGREGCSPGWGRGEGLKIKLSSPRPPWDSATHAECPICKMVCTESRRGDWAADMERGHSDSKEDTAVTSPAFLPLSSLHSGRRAQQIHTRGQAEGLLSKTPRTGTPGSMACSRAGDQQPRKDSKAQHPDQSCH